MKRFRLIDWKGIVLGSVMDLSIAIFTILFLFEKLWYGFLMAFILWISITLIFIDSWFMKKVEISQLGVKYISRSSKIQLRWEDIKKIGVTDLFIGARGGAEWIYFSTRCNIGSSIHGNMIGEGFIMLRYRMSVMKEIRKYWTGYISDYKRDK